MYIAFKWLTTMAFVMWIAMCAIDIYVKKHIGERSPGHNNINHYRNMRNVTMKKAYPTDFIEKRFDIPMEKRCHQPSPKQQNFSILLFVMFAAGALTISLFNRRKDMVYYTKRKVSDIQQSIFIERLKQYSKDTAIKASVSALKYYAILCNFWKSVLCFAKDIKKKCLSIRIFHKHNINLILLQKLKETGVERRNFAQLLLAAIQENKNIRARCALECMAKNRLARHIEDANKAIKENNSRYINFHHMFLATHQENIFLKSRLKNISQEKADTEKNLQDLINEVHKSKNKELIEFCSRFNVKTKDNLLNSDIVAEIDIFLQRSDTMRNISDNRRRPLNSSFGDCNTYDWVNCINELCQNNSNDALISSASVTPKLKGLPGECLWTVKDKDGLIEKLYEYDFESDRDTIKRIRQYSVYYDNDCLLDVSSSNNFTSIHNPGYQLWGNSPSTTRQGFLTGSEAFQRFLKNNNNVVCRTSAQPLMCR